MGKGRRKVVDVMAQEQVLEMCGERFTALRDIGW